MIFHNGCSLPLVVSLYQATKFTWKQVAHSTTHPTRCHDRRPGSSPLHETSQGHRPACYEAEGVSSRRHSSRTSGSQGGGRWRCVHAAPAWRATGPGQVLQARSPVLNCSSFNAGSATRPASARCAVALQLQARARPRCTRTTFVSWAAPAHSAGPGTCTGRNGAGIIELLAACSSRLKQVLAFRANCSPHLCCGQPVQWQPQPSPGPSCTRAPPALPASRHRGQHRPCLQYPAPAGAGGRGPPASPGSCAWFSWQPPLLRQAMECWQPAQRLAQCGRGTRHERPVHACSRERGGY